MSKWGNQKSYIVEAQIIQWVTEGKKMTEMVHKILHRKPKIEQHEHTKNGGWGGGV